jgi:hypothetical protein
MIVDRENYIRVVSELTSIYVDVAVRLLLKVENVAAMKIEANRSLVFLVIYH